MRTASSTLTAAITGAVVALAGCASPNVSGDDDPSSSVVEGETADASPQAIETTAVSTPSKPELQRRDVEVVEYGASGFRFSDGRVNASWAVILTNPNPDIWLASSVDVTVTLVDSSGAVLASQSDSVAVILPGQQAALAGVAYDVEGIANMRVQARVRQWEEGEGPFGDFTTSGVAVKAEQYGGLRVTGSVASTFDRDFTDPKAVAVLRDDSGKIVGGGYTYVDFIPAGGDTSFEVMVIEDIQNAASAEVIVSLTSLSLFGS